MPKDRHTKDPWSETPPDDRGTSFITLIRAPARGTLKIVATSYSLIGRDTHYFGGRTIPCIGNGCRACEELMVPRWLGYFGCVTADHHTQHIFEMTATNALLVKEQRLAFGTLRGIQIEAWRVNGKPNGRVAMRFHGLHPRPHELPTEINVIACLQAIWGMRAGDHTPEDGADRAAMMKQADAIEKAEKTRRAQAYTTDNKEPQTNGRK